MWRFVFFSAILLVMSDQSVADELVLLCKVKCEDMKRSPGMCKVASDNGVTDEFLLKVQGDGETDTLDQVWAVSETEFRIEWRAAQEGVVATRRATISRISGDYSEVSGYAMADKSFGEGYTRKGHCEKYDESQKKF